LLENSKQERLANKGLQGVINSHYINKKYLTTNNIGSNSNSKKKLCQTLRLDPTFSFQSIKKKDIFSLAG